MRIKRLPDDFMVEERLSLPVAQEGTYAYYRVEKTGQTTLAVRNALAARLKVTPSALVFPALKDKAAVAVQYASVRKRGPEEIHGKGYVARRVGWGPRALRPGDLSGNRFTIVVRDLSDDEAERLGPTLERLAAHGLPNYFDEQRFGSMTRDGLIGKEILKRDAERVVHMYLGESMAGDRSDVRKFKRLVASHWGQWGFLLHQAPRPSNYRSVITFLKDHPHDYRKAVNLIQDRLLSIYLSAYQSWVWNQIVGAYLEGDGPVSQHVRVLRSRLPVPEPTAETAALQEVLVDLPRLTARYEGPFEAPAAAVFEREQLELRDFKARILRRVYLTKGERPVAFAPEALTAEPPVRDDQDGEGWQMTVAFTLGAGRYATLVMKAAAALIGTEIWTR